MKNIYKKLSTLSNLCKEVSKDGHNQAQNYKYASAANVAEVVNQALQKSQLVAFVNYDLIKSDLITDSKGTIWKYAEVKCSVKVVDIDDGSEILFSSFGSGQDMGDKAIAKAQTMALKYAWITSLQMSYGDDPEKDESVDINNGFHTENITSYKTTDQSKNKSNLERSCSRSNCDGKLVEKTSKTGKTFYGCSNYQKTGCDFTSWDK